MRQRRLSPRLRSIGVFSRTFVRRSSFVSYSGLSSPKPKLKHNVKTPRVPYQYPKEQKFNTFFTNGRPRFPQKCLLLCDVLFELGNESFWEESHSHLRGAHAEVKALMRINTKEKRLITGARLVMLYLSYSPCIDCAEVILRFSEARPNCAISLAFSCLYRHEEMAHQEGLRRLNAAPQISLKVLTTGNEWLHLAHATDTQFRFYAKTRDEWDSKWQAVLDSILSKQFQDVESTSIMIAPNESPHDDVLWREHGSSYRHHAVTLREPDQVPQREGRTHTQQDETFAESGTGFLKKTRARVVAIVLFLIFIIAIAVFVVIFA